jgi:hypothetical protein
VTVATVGIAAWIWSERKDDDEDHPHPPPGAGFNPPGAGYPPHDPAYPQGPGYPQQAYPQPPPGSYPAQAPGYPPTSGYPPVPGEPYGRNPDGSIRTAPPSYADVRPGEVAYGTEEHQQPQSYIAQMSGALGGALRRTPSPQQFISGATRSVTAGVAAAGAAVGSLFPIREEDKNAYTDHKTWSEEAEVRRPGAGPDVPSQDTEKRSGNKTAPAAAPASASNKRRKTVAIVISADSGHHGDLDEEDHFHEHSVCIPPCCMKYADNLVYLVPPPSEHGFLQDSALRAHLCSRIEGPSP